MSHTLPVTVLASVGKTDATPTLKALLRQTKDTRLTAIVSRRHQKRLRTTGDATVLPTTEKLLKLGKGCACCTVRGDLMSKLKRVATENSADHVIVHASPHADLETLAKTFTVPDTTGATLSDHAQLENLVAVVDAATALQILPTDGARPLIERIELANVVVWQGLKHVSDEERSQLEGVVQALNPTARRVQDDGPLELSTIRSEQSFDLASAQHRSSRLGSEDTDFGTSGWLSQFTFFDRRPFHPERLNALLQESWSHVIRVQGSFWVASSPDFSITLDIAGGSRQVRCEGKWWVTVPAERRPTSPGFRQYLDNIWDAEFGDRHQAITIVGMNMDREALTERLERCLLTKQELSAPDTWASMPHPFSWPRHAQ